MLKKSMLLMLALLLMRVSSEPVFAAEHAAEVNAKIAAISFQDTMNSQVPSAVNESRDRFKNAVLKMESHMHIGRNGQLSLDLPRGETLGIDPILFTRLKAGMEKANEYLRDGRLRLSDIHFLSPIIDDRFIRDEEMGGPSDVASGTFANIYADSGSNIKLNWWGPTIYLDHATCELISYYFVDMGDVLGAAALLTAAFAETGAGGAIAIACGIDALLCDLIGNIAQQMDSLGGDQGVWIDLTWFGLVVGAGTGPIND